MGTWVREEPGQPFRRGRCWRHDNTVKYVIPWIQSVRPITGGRIIDFGAGCGSSSLAFSRFAGEVYGFEIDPSSAAAFRKRMDMFGVSNAHMIEGDPTSILEPALTRIVCGSTVALIAVVEHLLEQERIEYLSAIWNRLSPGDLLVIAETPNFYAYLDTHTFGVPFAHMVPDSYFVEWLSCQPADLRFRESLLAAAAVDGEGAVLEARRRLGME